MDFAADILMIAGTLGVAFYCFVLSRRLTRFTDLERGVGGAVAVLSAQVDDLTRALQSAREASEGSDASLRELTGRAEGVARKLEMHVASMHDLPGVPEPTPAAEPEAQDIPAPTRATPPVRSFFASHRNIQSGAAQ